MDPNAAAMQTRHARRIYVGGIPARVTEIEIANFFNDVVARALAPARLDGPPVVKVYLNLEKCYAFVEFTTIELCTACMQLDGLRFDHYTGPTTLRVRRPNDYRPELLPPSNAPIPQLNLSVLGITGSSSAAMGPNKLFVGGDGAHGRLRTDQSFPPSARPRLSHHQGLRLLRVRQSRPCGGCDCRAQWHGSGRQDLDHPHRQCAWKQCRLYCSCSATPAAAYDGDGWSCATNAATI